MTAIPLQIHSLRKAFGKKVVLDQSALSFAPGVHFMIGPNGSGKTTLFKCLAGIHTFEGKVTLPGGLDLQSHPVLHRQAVGFCPAEPLYPEYLSAADLLRFYAQVKGVDASAQARICTELGMDSYLSTKLSTYSSGMKKKLGIALALSGFPPLILLDEPYSALDQVTRKVVARLIAEGVAKGCTFLIASHLADLHAAFGEGRSYLLENACFRPIAAGESLPWLERLDNEVAV
jgi:ABC-2 type transport system ATP-binding protein